MPEKKETNLIERIDKARNTENTISSREKKSKQLLKIKVCKELETTNR